MPVSATAVVAGLILLAVVVLYLLRTWRYIDTGSYSARQKGIVVGLCLGLTFDSAFAPVAGMAFGYIVGSLIDNARAPNQISD
jgi:hypothetical protein